jgi:hypothetical protein
LAFGLLANQIRRKYLRISKRMTSVSASLITLFKEEWILQYIVLVIAVISLGLLSYFAPIHAVRVTVTPASPIGSDTPSIENIGLRTVRGYFPLQKETYTLADSADVYWSDMTLHWGEALEVVGRSGNGDVLLDSVAVWPVRTLINPFLPLSVSVAPPDRSVAISFRVEVPSDARILIDQPMDTEFVGVGVLNLIPGTPVSGNAQHSAYESEPFVFIVPDRDTSLEFSLNKKDGWIVVLPVNEGRQSVYGMKMFIDGRERSETPGETIRLAAGEHTVYLRKTDPSGSAVHVVDSFPINVQPGSTKTYTKTVVVKPLN